MADPIFWLGLSILLVAVSLAAILMAMLPALRELSRAARSAEKLFDTLNRELPPTLESIRLTGMEITDLTDEVSQGVQSAGRVVQQVDDSITGVKKQAQKAQKATRGLMVGVKTAWKTFMQPAPRRRPDRLPAAPSPFDFETGYEEEFVQERVEYWEETDNGWVEPEEIVPQIEQNSTASHPQKMPEVAPEYEKPPDYEMPERSPHPLEGELPTRGNRSRTDRP